MWGNSIVLVQLGGLEPPTSCSTDRRSNQLSYNCIPHAGPQRGGANGPETRCNASLWQGREASDYSRPEGILRSFAAAPRMAAKHPLAAKSPGRFARALRHQYRKRSGRWLVKLRGGSLDRLDGV